MPADREDVRSTTDPALVRSIVEERGGYPAHATGSEGQGDRGLLRVGDRDREADLKEVSWETFEAEFEEKGLEYRYPDDPADADEVGPVGELRRRSEE